MISSTELKEYYTANQKAKTIDGHILRLCGFRIQWDTSEAIIMFYVLSFRVLAFVEGQAQFVSCVDNIRNKIWIHF